MTHMLVVDGDSMAAGVFMCADMLMNTPITPPATANTPLASGRRRNKRADNSKIRRKLWNGLNVGKVNKNQKIQIIKNGAVSS